MNYVTENSLLFLSAFSILTPCVGAGIILWQFKRKRRNKLRTQKDRLGNGSMNGLGASFLKVLGVFLILLGLLGGGFAFEEALSGPKVKIAVSPEPPSFYMDTSITIEVEDPLGITSVSIFDETRTGKIIDINWGEETPEREWKATYRLQDLFKRNFSSQNLSELQIQIIVTNTIGKQTTINKRINFNNVVK